MTVQRRMGHSSATVTLDVYSHQWPDSEEKTRAAVDSYLGNPADYVGTRNTSPQDRGLSPDYIESHDVGSRLSTRCPCSAPLAVQPTR